MPLFVCTKAHLVTGLRIGDKVYGMKTTNPASFVVTQTFRRMSGKLIFVKGDVVQMNNLLSAWEEVDESIPR